MNWIITIVIACVQLFFFGKTRKNLREAKELFAEDKKFYKLKDEKEVKTIISESKNPTITTLVEELNEYIKTNIGTTDFSIIQNKTERYVKIKYENATSSLSSPTYIGLLGTFLGILLGLIGFERIPDISETERVSNLISGVMISMSTSLIGLLLTIISNSIAAETKKALDERKNIFYNFIQNELMPQLGTSIVTALAKLRETLNTFGPTFTDITKNFKETFDECTSNFGKEFRLNCTILTQAVAEMGKTVGKINDNVENQRLLLEEIRSNEMGKTLQQFIHASDKLAESSHTIEELAKLRIDLAYSVEGLLTAQEGYIKKLYIPTQLLEKTESILNRVSTFEKSINNLGHAISNTELLGSAELRAIDEHLAIIRKKNDLAAEYIEKEEENLRKLYQEQVNSIRELNQKYRIAIDEHAEEFYKLMNSVSAEIEKRRIEFIEKLENSFDLKNINDEFLNLYHLPDILQRLKELKEVITDKQSLLNLLNIIHSSVNKLDISVNQQSETQQKAVKALSTKIEETISEISESITDHYDEENHQLAEIKEAVAAHQPLLTSIHQSVDRADKTLVKISKDQQDSTTEIASSLKENISALETKIYQDTEQKSEEVKKVLRNIVEDLNARHIKIAKEQSQFEKKITELQQLLKAEKQDINTIEKCIKDITEKLKSINTFIHTNNYIDKHLAEHFQTQKSHIIEILNTMQSKKTNDQFILESIKKDINQILEQTQHPNKNRKNYKQTKKDETTNYKVNEQ